ncbi:MAG: hypothetical protein J0L79_05695 [Rickettsiales bacterium]|nr:hypothetical protein [Rickettsiales bacterium]MCA0253956.1 hypothetical protein [Pseudomonadota bacterium]
MSSVHSNIFSEVVRTADREVKEVIRAIQTFLEQNEAPSAILLKKYQLNVKLFKSFFITKDGEVEQDPTKALDNFIAENYLHLTGVCNIPSN